MSCFSSWKKTVWLFRYLSNCKQAQASSWQTRSCYSTLEHTSTTSRTEKNVCQGWQQCVVFPPLLEFWIQQMLLLTNRNVTTSEKGDELLLKSQMRMAKKKKEKKETKTSEVGFCDSWTCSICVDCLKWVAPEIHVLRFQVWMWRFNLRGRRRGKTPPLSWSA